MLTPRINKVLMAVDWFLKVLKKFHNSDMLEVSKYCQAMFFLLKNKSINCMVNVYKYLYKIHHLLLNV